MVGIKPPLVLSDDPSDVPRTGRTVDLRGLFVMHADYVWNTLRRMGVPESDVEDLTHEVFIQVGRHLADYDPTRPARAWLFGFAFRIACRERRRAYHRYETHREAPDAIESADPRALPDEELAASRDRQLVLDALAAVPIDRRAVFVLYEIDGLPMDEISRSLGIPLNTGYSRLRVARTDFAAAVRRLRSKRGER